MFCAYFRLQDLPRCVNTLCLYAKFLSRSFKSVQAIQNYLSGVKTLHSLLDLDYPREDMLQLKLLVRGISRDKQHIPRKAEPITPTILIDMLPYLSKPFYSVLWCAFLLMFFSMARKSNMFPNSLREFDADKQLLRRDVTVQDDLLFVNIKWSKTRQFGHLKEIPVCSISGSCLCAVATYKNMIALIPALTLLFVINIQNLVLFQSYIRNFNANFVI